MSFAKAKLQRFNETKVCTPSPAKYNVSSHRKLKYGFFSTEKFTKRQNSPPCSEIGSIRSTPCFQTPTVPKKKKFLGLSATKPKISHIDLEELKEKKVECKNKDVYINELIEQIDDMKEKIFRLEKDVDYFDEIKANYEQTIGDTKAKHKSDFKSVSGQVLQLHDELRKIQHEYNQLKEESCFEIAQLFAHISKFEGLHNKSLETYKTRLERKQLEYCEKVDEIQAQHRAEIDNLRKQLKEKSEKLQKFVNLNQKFEILLEEKQAKIRQLEENFQDVSTLNQIQINEKITEIESSWRTKFKQLEDETQAILKECQQISEYNVTQSEYEKSKIRAQLRDKEQAYDGLKLEYEEFVDRYKSLDLDSQRVHQTVSNYEEQLSKIRQEKRAYEIALRTFQDAIEVLKRRLLASDRDVEQLKEELGMADRKILSYETQVLDLRAKLGEAQLSNEELEMQYEATSKLVHSHVKGIEQQLLGKVGVLEDQLKTVKTKAEGEKELLSEVIEQHYEQQVITNHARELIEQSNELINGLEADKVQLDRENGELRRQLHKAQTKLEQESEDGAVIRKKYIEKSGKFDELSHQFEQLLQELDRMKAKNCELEKKNEAMRATKGRKSFIYEDKENLASPKRNLIRVESPGPLKEKN